MGLKSFFLGEDPEDIVLDPRLEAERKRRAGLVQILEDEAAGTVQTPGELAALAAGERTAEKVGSQISSRAAGARGFGRLAALSEAQQLATQAEQATLGDAAERAEAERVAGVERARTGLVNLSQAELDQLALEEKMRKFKAKGGALSSILGAAGAIGGAALGGEKGAKLGLQTGGTLGFGLSEAGR